MPVFGPFHVFALKPLTDDDSLRFDMTLSLPRLTPNDPPPNSRLPSNAVDLTSERLGAKYGVPFEAWMVRFVSIASAKDPELVSLFETAFASRRNRDRSHMALAVAECLGIEPERLIPFAAACEILHEADRLFTDIREGSGHPNKTISLGLVVLSLAVSVAEETTLDDGLGQSIIRRISEEAIRIMEGRRRLDSEADPAFDDCTEVGEETSCGLFALSLAGSAEICGAPPHVVRALVKNGKRLEAASQIATEDAVTDDDDRRAQARALLDEVGANRVLWAYPDLFELTLELGDNIDSSIG